MFKNQNCVIENELNAILLIVFYPIPYKMYLHNSTYHASTEKFLLRIYKYYSEGNSEKILVNLSGLCQLLELNKISGHSMLSLRNWFSVEQ